MKTIPMLLKEMDQEAETTHKMLACVPNDKYEWRPHPKSMSIGQLTAHIADLPNWVAMVLTTEELDFAINGFNEDVATDTTSLLESYERSLANGRAHLEKATEENLLPNWTLRNGEAIYDVSPKHEVIRMSFCQTVHHRAQLGVFLRLLDIPIPGSYGPSADEMGAFNFDAAQA